MKQLKIITYVTYIFFGLCYTILTEGEMDFYGQELFNKIS